MAIQRNFIIRILSACCCIHIFAKLMPEVIGDAVNSINKRNIIYASGKYIKSLFTSPVEITDHIFKSPETAYESYDYILNIIVKLSGIT